MSGIVTISDLRRITGLPSHVINHALNRHGPEPSGRIGIYRVWSRDALPEIQRSIARTARKPGVVQESAEEAVS